MNIAAVCILGFILDLIFGDPPGLYHPVCMIGNLISCLEKICRRLCGNSKYGLLAGGFVIWGIVLSVSFGIPAALLSVAGRIHPAFAFCLEVFWCFQILAAKSLKTESMKVYDQLQAHDLAGAQKAVSMIVGRDTEALSEEGVTKAAVETVAENTSDGVVAPLLFLMIGGAPLGFAYKAINTMDSMLGYKDEKYLYIGRAAAKADDLVNFIPARISALLMIGAAFLLKMDGKNAWKIFCRDRYKHASPNAAQTEAACAGALDIRLAGDAWYFGKRYPKEYIGDNLRPVEPEDIRRANHLLYGTAVLALAVFEVVRILAVIR